MDQATLSPPEGYKDGSGILDAALGGALGGHVFGAQHIQQLQVIQRLQQQRAAMLAARAAVVQGQPATPGTITTTPATSTTNNIQNNNQAVCTECAECAECAAKQLLDEGKKTCVLYVDLFGKLSVYVFLYFLPIFLLPKSEIYGLQDEI